MSIEYLRRVEAHYRKLPTHFPPHHPAPRQHRNRNRIPARTLYPHVLWLSQNTTHALSLPQRPTCGSLVPIVTGTARRTALRSSTTARLTGACHTASFTHCMRGYRTRVACRSLYSSTPALSPSPSEHVPTSTTSATTPITSIAKQGSNQLSLEHPQNRAGACNATSKSSPSLCTSLEYVLSTLDKVVNWARQGSMWPMTFGA